MISSEQLLVEIEQQVRLARHAANEQTRREAVSAVRALCNVMLSNSATETGKLTFQHKPNNLPQHASIGKPVTSLQEQPMREEDANGESLFDF
ncbi:YwdI family protein [Sporosarcina obsidiansis]|uniref:YwdI family protein n=1 Tax=Sporosarcina obsidiansis TaxID=2660748 RepID=UPI00129A57F4|nr:YwdI family protein [Sporosarcina obsidiansis]